MRFFTFSRPFSRFAAIALLAFVAGCATRKAPQVSIRVPTPESHSMQGLSAPGSLWDRIRRGFAMQDLYNSTVSDKEAYYSSRTDYMQRMGTRSNKYLYHVVEELERRRMPTELALLPFVESAFNPLAVSSAKAAGMWQFIPSTGRHYSLKQNVFRDERRDIVRSTNAALDYLQRLYAMFGDWHLALAAYNWGEGNVQRAIARNQAAGLGTRYEDLRMPNETREYVPKLQALKNIVRNPATFNANLPDVPNHPYFEKVAINRDIDVDIAARLAGISVQDFKALNPAMNKPLVIASVTPHILLPWASVPVFKRNLAAMGDKPLASWTVWVPAESVTLAQAAEKTGASVDELRQVNHIPAHVRIRAGSPILVPRHESHDMEIPQDIANSNISLTPEIVARASAQHVVLKQRNIKARKGDTVARIAARYGLSPATVAKWNRVKPNQKLASGKTVVLHLPQSQGRGAVIQASTRSGRGNDHDTGRNRKLSRKEQLREEARGKAANKNGKRGKAGKADQGPTGKKGKNAARASAKAESKSVVKDNAKNKARPQQKEKANAKLAKTTAAAGRQAAKKKK